MNQLHGHLLRFPAGSSVSDGDVLHVVLFDHPGEGGDGLLLLPLPIGGIDHGGVQNLAGGVHHRHFTAHAVTGVQAHGDLALDGRLHQKGPQVQGELADGPLCGGFGQSGAGLPLQGGKDQAVIGVLRRGLDELHGPAAGHHHAAAHRPQGQLPVQLHTHLQLFLPLAPVDGKDLVSLQPGKGLGKIVIQAVDAVLLHGGHGAEDSLLHHQLPELAPDGSVVADGLGYDVGGAGEGFLRCLHALFGIRIFFRLCQRVGTVGPLGEEHLRQRLQALFPGHGGPGAALLLIGAVKILHLRQGLGIVNGSGQLLRQLPLLLNGFFHRLPPFLEAPEIGKTLFQRAQGGVIHGPMEFLAVAGDEGDGIALVQKGDDVFNVPGVLPQLLSQNFYDFLHGISFLRGGAAPGRFRLLQGILPSPARAVKAEDGTRAQSGKGGAPAPPFSYDVPKKPGFPGAGEKAECLSP